ncbi:tetratricopeptide repeat protein [Nocardiopsis sp. NPDC101807]|uniref:tetratricopeptide repeat protein n=1 Tax=Nocardiopsis sp. NPDC101807 TaxID=3364339 RepID=UPI0038148FE8
MRRAKRSDAQEEPVPAYVPRDFDAALDRAILAGGLVVLEGESVSGKTRSAYEAIRRTVPDRRLVVPSDEQSLTAIADLPTAPRNSVVWLDGVDRYLAAGTLDEGVLDRLCPPGRSDVCIVATLDSRVRGDFPEQSAPAVTRILEDRAEHFFVERRLTGAEVERARELAGDRRIFQALAAQAEGGFAADISGAHTTLRRWRSAVHGHEVRAGAVISAAVDARRLGYRDPLPRGLLEDLHRHYLAPNVHHDPGTSTFDEALRWAADPAGGATACLSRVDEGTYEPFHHLVSHALRETDGAEVPEVVWTLVAHRIPVAYLPTFGFAAYETGRSTVAEHAWARFLERFPGHPEANLGMALLALRADDRAKALPSLRRAVANGDPRAMAHLGAVLARIALEGEDPSAAAEAGDRLRRAHDAGATIEAYLAGLLAYRAGDEDEALSWCGVAAGRGDENAMFLHACLETWGIDDSRLRPLLDEVLNGEKQTEKLAELLADLPHDRAEWSGGRPAFRACAWGNKAATAGNVHAMYLMGRSLEAGGRWDTALTLHKKAAKKGSLASARRVPVVYTALDERRRARAWREAVTRTAATGAAVSGVGALAARIFREYKGLGSGGGGTALGRTGQSGGTASHQGGPSSGGSASHDDASSYGSPSYDDSSSSDSSYSDGSSSSDSSSSSADSSSYGDDGY